METIKEYYEGKEILITGGTGSLGSTILKSLLKLSKPKGIRIFSRDEYKQHILKEELRKAGLGDAPISFLIGDVRDRERLYRALERVDIVFNTAAMKQVPACEYNPEEPIKTNIIGAQNLLNGAIDCRVDKVMHVSTDKAVYPVNIYGATKLVAEKLFIHGNAYSGTNALSTKFSCCRYGNVIGSRGSILPLFKEQAKTGKITITDYDMTRFWITLEQVVVFIIKNTAEMAGGEIFIPKMKSVRIKDIARCYPDCEIEAIGIRKGEKLHECLITEEESPMSTETENGYIIYPNSEWSNHEIRFTYNSKVNEFLPQEVIKGIINGNNV